MTWYVNAKNELVRSSCYIAVQKGVPESTVGIHDYFAGGHFITEIPSHTFLPPHPCY